MICIARDDASKKFLKDHECGTEFFYVDGADVLEIQAGERTMEFHAARKRLEERRQRYKESVGL